jgi:hypothetical protein
MTSAKSFAWSAEILRPWKMHSGSVGKNDTFFFLLNLDPFKNMIVNFILNLPVILSPKKIVFISPFIFLLTKFAL